MKKLTKEDIQKYGTEEEKKIINENDICWWCENEFDPEYDDIIILKDGTKMHRVCAGAYKRENTIDNELATKLGESKMKPTREDVEKYGTEDEKKLLKEERGIGLFVVVEMGEGFSEIKRILGVCSDSEKGLENYNKLKKRAEKGKVHTFNFHLDEIPF